MPLSGGSHYRQSDNNKDYGMNFGLGIPLGFSKVDLGFEFGKRGTTTNNIIEENYFNDLQLLYFGPQ